MIHWFIWLGVYAFSFWMLFLCSSSAAATVLTYLTIFFSPALLAFFMGGNVSLPWRVAAELSFMAPLIQMWVGEGSQNLVLELLGGNTPLYAAVICLLWWLFSLVVGGFVFHRREIK